MSMDITAYLVNISKHFTEFADALHTDPPVEVLSITVVGSTLTPDFSPESSDINSIVVVNEITVAFLDYMVERGRTYRSKNIAAPMLMTPQYIHSSLDVFPIEFFNFRKIHHTVSGSDALAALDIKNTHLRLQCEREMKSKLLWLHQGYISALGDDNILTRRLSQSITGYLPLFRAILHLAGHSLSLSGHETAAAVEKVIGLDNGIFTKILAMKHAGQAAAGEELCDCFNTYYQATQRLSEYVETLPA